jgi:hypothetical protein
MPQKMAGNLSIIMLIKLTSKLTLIKQTWCRFGQNHRIGTMLTADLEKIEENSSSRGGDG